MPNRCREDWSIFSRQAFTLTGSFSWERAMKVMPMTTFSGVRMSCEMLERNCDFALLARFAWARASWRRSMRRCWRFRSAESTQMWPAKTEMMAMASTNREETNVSKGRGRKEGWPGWRAARRSLLSKNPCIAMMRTSITPSKAYDTNRALRPGSTASSPSSGSCDSVSAMHVTPFRHFWRPRAEAGSRDCSPSAVTCCS